jgi:hypothetical protein
MSEWWTYDLRDLLLFSPRTYYRLFELHNLEWWPLPLVTLAFGLVLFALAWHGGTRMARAALVLLGGAWLWVAWAWQFERYAPINWAAEYFAWAWAAQGVLLLIAAAFPRSRLASRRQRLAGLLLLAYAVAAHPLWAPLLERGWVQAEVFGMAPDPTALATLGALLALRLHVGLAVLPAVWCLLSGATLWAMASPEFWAVPLGAALALTATWAYRARR